ncbi:hypothetical protein RhiJN_23883 [Ceratobasidium sp. AG-Ba]|nr:hypothetical protein RhiJN_23883 [Ceratobasidium sp. AG-Ba]
MASITQKTQDALISTRVIEMPELLDLICSFADVSDCARLSRTSKAAFEIAVPFVWREVEGVKNILSLIGATYTMKIENFYGPEPIITVPSLDLAFGDFTRLNLYGPLVHMLHIWGPPETEYSHYQIHDWERLMPYAQHQTLLPNLSSLIFSHSSRGFNYPLWIRLFVSPSLTSILIDHYSEPDQPWITVSMADIVLDILAEECPRLFRLAIFPTYDANEEELDPPHGLIKPMTGCAHHQLLREFTALSELTCPLTLLKRQSFVAIGSLPGLRRLCINAKSDSGDLEPDVISPGSFPKLQELCLADTLTPFETIQILNILPLVEKITRLELAYTTGDFEDGGDIENHAEHIVSEVLPPLKNARCLSVLDFYVNYDGASIDDNGPYDVGHQSLVEIFAALPLHTIVMRGAHIGSWMRDSDALSVAWSNMVKVSLWDQKTPLDSLWCFTHLPKLEFLLLAVQFETASETPAAIPISPLQTLECSAYRYKQYDVDQVSYFDQFVKSMRGAQVMM